MTIKLTALASFIALAVTGCATQGNDDEAVVKKLANNLDVTYEIVTQHGAEEGLQCKTLGAEWASCDLINLTLKNNGPAVTGTDWKIYFSSIRQILEVQNDQFKVTHVTGDLHTLEPTDKFDGFAEGETVVIPYIGEYWTLFENDYMPRAYVTSGDAAAQTIKSTDSTNPGDYLVPLKGDQFKRVKADNNVLATAETRFKKNQDINVLATTEVAATIVPTPLSTKLTGKTVSLANGIKISNFTLPADMMAAVNERLGVLGVNTKGQYPVKVSLLPGSFAKGQQIAGAYTLDVTPTGATVIGFDDQGAFYGMQSLISLMSTGAKNSIPTLEVTDAPRFDYRGVMVDVGRNFHSKAVILRTLDQMAAYKMNKFHFHLSDDEGWRVEIPGLPELTDIGSKRCHDLSETTCLLPQLGSGPTSDTDGSGYYSKQDYLDILKYAKARGIEVIPEIDMPAHARAAVVAMEARYKRLAAEGKMDEANEYRLMDPQDTSNVTTVQFYDKRSFINPCMDSSTKFVDKVITEIQAMHKEAGMPLNTWHFGGDEAKNIKLNAGFQDLNAAEKTAWTGSIDQSKQNKPYQKSPMCQKLIAEGVVADYDHLPSHFAEQISEVVNSKGIKNFQAWQDGLKHSSDSKAFGTDNVRVNFWDVLYWGGGASAYEWADKGYDVVVSNPDYVYMDMPYEVDPIERGYYWATRATDTRKMFGFAPENLPQNAETSLDRDGNGFTSKGTVKSKGFYGLSAQLWSETVGNDKQYEYMVFPRVLAAAERAWHKGEWENEYQVGVEYSQDSNHVNKKALHNEWQRFANVLGQRELAKLDAAGIQYRVPVPGAKIENGKLAMNVSMPGLTLQYSTDEGKTWNTYDAKAQPSVTGKVEIRAVSGNGKRFSRVTSL
ncbi:beta-N-acetylhexosaminidase [Photobacterium iliopiscarium]|jgi:hexosaminidase|uniref:beta-N-acetylhexosaminidase n=1 Tax=Photobacterium iliopiscarium TaxID=56192 RepID=A0A0D8PPQ9_9GAMM|nr:beta-N-acetylhexosaminidase [Photobacterium iliopiscarium]KJG14934.1 beta-N-acetylhexosaminidase [Photobacterium iliopiscarium]KJG20540.1 beta-N-acetylhexosaminidase [Photobacterium iliopiscarium]PST97062.1 beta-N-acetylhexosaminidase [Photobacterium iliopiscarium]PSU02010.1 beta-N-acetylhexosaminidase [Photobacterium iliopiscarium]PSV84358.1 beta-N-acetylhexosaminidase [Photobacterium iliopiscarium]